MEGRALAVFWSLYYNQVKGGRGGGAYAFGACLGHLTVDHAFISRRSTVPTSNRDTSNIWVLITPFSCITWKLFAHPIRQLFRRLWPPLSPGIAIVFSLLSSLPHSPMSLPFEVKRVGGVLLSARLELLGIRQVVSCQVHCIQKFM